MTRIDWSKFAPAAKPNELGNKFEELCYDLLDAMGYRNLDWRDGGGDQGRDIEAELVKDDIDGETFMCHAAHKQSMKI
jgi:hypothetical protein